MNDRQPLKIRAAIRAGKFVRVMRPLGRILPGTAGALAIAVGLGQVAGHVFGHRLAWWVALTVAGLFALWFGAELNAQPRVRRDVSSED